MTPKRGNPQVLVRMDQETLDKAQAVYPSVRGRSGGVASALRRLLHVLLDEPIPKQYGELRRHEQLDQAEEFFREAALSNFHEPSASQSVQELVEILGSDLEPVDRLRAHALLGKWAEVYSREKSPFPL